MADCSLRSVALRGPSRKLNLDILGKSSSSHCENIEGSLCATHLAPDVDWPITLLSSNCLHKVVRTREPTIAPPRLNRAIRTPGK